MKSENFPNVKPGDWIFIGSDHLKLPAVVCNIVQKDLIPVEGDIEVVYIDSRDRPINEGAIWTGSVWKFKCDGPNGGYADRSDRLKEYVDILRRGKYNLR